MSKKKRLSEGILGNFFKGLFGTLNIDKHIAKQVLKDPRVQKQMKQVQKSMAKIEDAANYLKSTLQNDDNVY